MSHLVAALPCTECELTVVINNTRKHVVCCARTYLIYNRRTHVAQILASAFFAPAPCKSFTGREIFWNDASWPSWLALTVALRGCWYLRQMDPSRSPPLYPGWLFLQKPQGVRGLAATLGKCFVIITIEKANAMKIQRHSCLDENWDVQRFLCKKPV